MNYKLCILIFAIMATSGCKSYAPLLDLSGKMVRGKIIDQESGEPMIGQSIIEFNSPNGTITDTSGYFELQFQGNHPILELSGFYEPLYVKINPDEYNLILLDEGLSKKSRKLFKKVFKYLES